MTGGRMALLELIEKAADADLLREMLAFAAKRIQKAETLKGAARGARGALRETRRDGYRDRDRDARIERAIPKLRKGGCFHSFPDLRRIAAKALAPVIREASVHGVSTRAVDDLVKSMGASGTSESAVSLRRAEIGERTHALLQRPLDG